MLVCHNMKVYSFMWYDWPHIQYSSLFESVTNGQNSEHELIPATEKDYQTL